MSALLVIHADVTLFYFHLFYVSKRHRSIIIIPLHFKFTNPTSKRLNFDISWILNKKIFSPKKKDFDFSDLHYFLFCFRTIYTSTLQLCNSKFIFNDLNLYSSNYIPLYQQSINQTCIVYPNVSFLNFMFSFNSRIQSFYSRTRPCATVDHKVV